MSSTEGLRGVVAGNSSICTVDGQQGKLVYRGIDISELAEQATFEEVAYLLWHGRLPKRSELDELQAQLHANATLPQPVMELLRLAPHSAKPMDVLRTAVSALGMWDPDAGDNSAEANLRKSIRLTAQIPTIITSFNHLRNGREPVAPRDDLSVAANFLYMLDGELSSEVAVKTFDVALTLHADHEFNASTFSARVTIATLSDVYSAVTAAIGTLSGPLHGGANEGVFRMLQEVGSVENVEPYIKAKLAQKGARVMGIGHAVYKTTDPRARHLKKMAESLTSESGNRLLFDMSTRIEQMMLDAKGLHANVDFYSASVYHVLGIPTDLFTPVFAISRITGWTAHILEQLSDNRIIRPRAEYVGPVDQHYVPIEQR
ncbi:MAG TPA: citrate synthase [Armatimonadota bacterium]|nr:citrate synthase [Armatimonadota bacterium]